MASPCSYWEVVTLCRSKVNCRQKIATNFVLACHVPVASVFKALASHVVKPLPHCAIWSASVTWQRFCCCARRTAASGARSSAAAARSSPSSRWKMERASRFRRCWWVSASCRPCVKLHHLKLREYNSNLLRKPIALDCYLSVSVIVPWKNNRFCVETAMILWAIDCRSVFRSCCLLGPQMGHRPENLREPQPAL